MRWKLMEKVSRQIRSSAAFSLASIGNRKNEAVLRAVASDWHTDLADKTNTQVGSSSCRIKFVSESGPLNDPGSRCFGYVCVYHF